LRFHLIEVQNQIQNDINKKDLPFFMSCLFFFALAIDTAADFLSFLSAVRVDFGCERLAFEEDAV
jgi:hypothetical protein